MRSVVIAMVVLMACKSKPREETPRPTSFGSAVTGDMVVQPGVTDHALRFVIDEVFAHQKPSDKPPYHAAGGSLVYFRAHVAGDEKATFLVGMPEAGAAEDASFSKMWLAPTTPAAGAAVVAAFARQFEVPVPPLLNGAPVPLEMGAAMLGHGLGKGDGYSGTGTWDATKWFCTTEEIDGAEVFFNVSLETREGEFSEKDVDYSADIARCLAIALRDGKPPPRTPATDPTLAADAPHLDLGVKVTPVPARAIALAPGRALLAYDDGSASHLVAVNPGSGAAKEIAKLADRIQGGTCDPSATRCVIRATTPNSGRGTVSSDDPAQLHYLDGATLTALKVPAFGTEPELTHAPLSPDGTWIVAAKVLGKNLVAYNRVTKKSLELATDKRLEVVAWRGATAVLRESIYAKGRTDKAFLWHLETGSTTPETTAEQAPPETEPVSPDGKLRADFTEERTLIITPQPSGAPRTLTFYPSDGMYVRPGCCGWIDDRHLLVEGRQMVIVDAVTMKVGLLPDHEGEREEFDVADGNRYALVDREDGTYLAKLVLP